MANENYIMRVERGCDALLPSVGVPACDVVLVDEQPITPGDDGAFGGIRDVVRVGVFRVADGSWRVQYSDRAHKTAADALSEAERYGANWLEAKRRERRAIADGWRELSDAIERREAGA